MQRAVPRAPASGRGRRAASGWNCGRSFGTALGSVSGLPRIEAWLRDASAGQGSRRPRVGESVRRHDPRYYAPGRARDAASGFRACGPASVRTGRRPGRCLGAVGGAGSISRLYSHQQHERADHRRCRRQRRHQVHQSGQSAVGKRGSCQLFLDGQHQGSLHSLLLHPEPQGYGVCAWVCAGFDGGQRQRLVHVQQRGQ